MDKKQTMLEVNRIFKVVFGRACPYSLDEVLSKFAFDIKLPQKVHDSTTGQETWAQSINPSRYITQNNMEKYDVKRGWMQPKQDVSNLNDILKLWKRVNYTTTERVYDSINVSESDPIYKSENVYRSTDIREGKNIIFCDGVGDSQSLIASQRSTNSSFGIRIEDSTTCINSYNIICSGKISNSFFIQDANNLHECMFCSHIANQRYCIANMQFEKDEYMAIKSEIIKWILRLT